MLRFLAARLAQSVAIVFAVVTLTFILIHLAPGDPLSAGGESGVVQPAIRAQLRRNFGLDQPVAVQYLRYLGNMARGRLGYSFAEQRPVAEAIGDRIGNTLLLAGSGLAIMFLLGMAIGVVQGMRVPSLRDDVLSVATLAAYSLPVFWLGLMLLLVFGEQLHWFPLGGTTDAVRHAHLPLVGRVWDRVTHLVLPALTLGAVGAASTARFQRAAFIEARRQDFVRTARAKGLPERLVLLRHTLRTALLPTITLFGLAFPVLLSGAVLVEKVFAWPGLGTLAVDAIGRRDYYVVTATAVIASVLVVIGNLLADILYRVADPRTRVPQ